MGPFSLNLMSTVRTDSGQQKTADPKAFSLLDSSVQAAECSHLGLGVKHDDSLDK